MGSSNKKYEDYRDKIASICYHAYSQAWPSKSRDGVRGKETGFDGARASRVLAGVLIAAWKANSLTVVTGLEPLGYEIGIVSHYAVRDALHDLHRLGWLKFQIGTQDDWSPGGDPGRASVITLLPKPSNNGLCPLDLPLPTLDIFREGEQGSPVRQDGSPPLGSGSNVEKIVFLNQYLELQKLFDLPA
jgi:hypothetical protein